MYLSAFNFNWGIFHILVIRTFPRGGVDMIYDGSQIPLGEKFKAGLLWQNHTKHCMSLFNAAFLTASHGITVINV